MLGSHNFIRQAALFPFSLQARAPFNANHPYKGFEIVIDKICEVFVHTTLILSNVIGDVLVIFRYIQCLLQLR
jgi:hypothetical protein